MNSTQPAPAPLPEEVKDLYPCPFCGSKRVRLVTADFKYAREMTYCVKCDNCGGYGPGVCYRGPGTSDASREEARTRWNTSLFTTQSSRLAEVEGVREDRNKLLKAWSEEQDKRETAEAERDALLERCKALEKALLTIAHRSSDAILVCGIAQAALATEASE